MERYSGRHQNILSISYPKKLPGSIPGSFFRTWTAYPSLKIGRIVPRILLESPVDKDHASGQFLRKSGEPLVILDDIAKADLDA